MDSNSVYIIEACGGNDWSRFSGFFWNKDVAIDAMHNAVHNAVNETLAMTTQTMTSKSGWFIHSVENCIFPVIMQQSVSYKNSHSLHISQHRIFRLVCILHDKREQALEALSSCLND